MLVVVVVVVVEEDVVVVVVFFRFLLSGPLFFLRKQLKMLCFTFDEHYDLLEQILNFRKDPFV